MNLAQYRNSPSERQRIDDLMRLLPVDGDTALDVGARDGYLSRRLAERYAHVVALDLERPAIDAPRIEPVRGDITGLAFPDRQFDLVFCAEVLEHIPPVRLARACSELARVARRHVLIGVPYRQDIRVGRSTCGHCGGANPPWGHVNRFDEARLHALFPGWTCAATSFVGRSGAATNALSTWLMDRAGNPWGTYTQDEPCIHCGAQLTPPPPATIPQRMLAKLAFWARTATECLTPAHGNWIHVLYERCDAA